MRILVWHGWRLEGAGSNVYTARIVATWREQGHDVVLMCQEHRPERHPFLDAWGTVGTEVGELEPLAADEAPGRAVLLRPAIGDVLPVFVYDRYGGFRVKTFADLPDEELEAYIDANVAALRTATGWHGSELVVAGHAFPGAVIARRALEHVPYIVKVHGSDVEYAMRVQRRYVDLAREGLDGAAAVAGASADVLARLVALVPSVGDRAVVASPGVEADRFRPLPRREALTRAAALLDEEAAAGGGRSSAMDAEVAAALRDRDDVALDRLAGGYDQDAPDPGAPERLRSLAGHPGPIVGYLGKLIPQKGVHHLIEALALLDPGPRALVIGYGTFREWLQALLAALDAGDAPALSFLTDRSPLTTDLSPAEVAAARGLAGRVAFTGRLDHRCAAPAVAAADVLVVPSILDEAFGMVAIEGAAAGALPLVARHSGLSEIAEALEAEIDSPGLLSYEPGPRAARNLAEAIDRLLALPAADRSALGERLSAYAAARWGWAHTAERLLRAGTRDRPWSGRRATKDPMAPLIGDIDDEAGDIDRTIYGP